MFKDNFVFSGGFNFANLTCHGVVLFIADHKIYMKRYINTRAEGFEFLKINAIQGQNSSTQEFIRKDRRRELLYYVNLIRAC